MFDGINENGFHLLLYSIALRTLQFPNDQAVYLKKAWKSNQETPNKLR